LGRKNLSFGNKSGKTQPIRTKFGLCGQINGGGATTFREFWARSADFGQNGGHESRGARVFLCGKPCTRPFGNFATADFYQIWSRNVFWCPVEESRKTLPKIFTLGVICPQNLKSKIGQTVKQAPQLEQATGHMMHYRDILFTPRHVVAKGQGVSEVRSTFLYNMRLRSQSCGVKVAQFSDFDLFSPYKTPKTYLPVTSL